MAARARIRRSTSDTRSLDDVMRLAGARYSGEKGFTLEEFKATAEEVAGVPLREFFATAAESVEELDYSEALEWFGLRFKTPEANENKASEKKAWLGADTKVEGGRLIVTKILRGTPAFEFGIDADDEIIAFDEYRVRADQFAKRLENYRPGDWVELLVARREKLRRVPVVLGEEPGKLWRLEVLPEPNPEQTAHLENWLGSGVVALEPPPFS